VIEGKDNDLNPPHQSTNWLICVRVPRHHNPHLPAGYRAGRRGYVFECKPTDTLIELNQRIRRDGLVPPGHAITFTEMYAAPADSKKMQINSGIPLLNHATSTRSSLRNQAIDLHAPTYFLPPPAPAVPGAAAPVVPPVSIANPFHHPAQHQWDEEDEFEFM
jgi:hypothetical protein